MKLNSLYHQIARKSRPTAWSVILLAAVMLTSACTTPSDSPVASATAVVEQVEEQTEPLATVAADTADMAEEGYPPPPPQLPEPPAEGYPTTPDLPPTATPLPDIYPPPAEEDFLEPRFKFDLPLQAGMNTVSGQAPPALALAVVDVTFNGALLGTGVSAPDGSFVINVAELPEGHRIGLTFAELEEGLSIADMSIKYYPYRGDGFMNIPNVGIMLETTLVE